MNVSKNKPFDYFEFETADVGGIKLHVKNLPWLTEAVGIGVMIRAGGRHDETGKEGLAHFFEHLPFNGCEGWPTNEHIKEQEKTMFLGTLNANTNFERTLYHGKVRRRDLVKALLFLKNFIFKPILDEDEIRREKGVISQEIWNEFNNEKNIEFSKRISRAMYSNPPFSAVSNILGYVDTISAFEKVDFQEFHSKYYVRQNTEVVMVGAITMEDSISLVRDHFLGSVPDTASKSVQFMEEWPNPNESVIRLSARDYFGLSESATPKHSRIALEWITAAVSPNLCHLNQDFLSGVIYDKIRNDFGCTYSPSVQYHQHGDHDHMKICLTVEPSMCDRTVGALQVIRQNIECGDCEYLPKFNREKGTIISSLTVADHKIQDILRISVNDLSIFGSIQSVAKDISQLERITYEQISAYYTERLTPEKCLLTVIDP